MTCWCSQSLEEEEQRPCSVVFIIPDGSVECNWSRRHQWPTRLRLQRRSAKLNVFFLGSHTVSTCFIFTHFQNRSFERSERSVFTRNEKSEEGRLGHSFGYHPKGVMWLRCITQKTSSVPSPRRIWASQSWLLAVTCPFTLGGAKVSRDNVVLTFLVALGGACEERGRPQPSTWRMKQGRCLFEVLHKRHRSFSVEGSILWAEFCKRGGNGEFLWTSVVLHRQRRWCFMSWSYLTSQPLTAPLRLQPNAHCMKLWLSCVFWFAVMSVTPPDCLYFIGTRRY